MRSGTWPCCFWPILTPRDFLPLAPLAAIAIAVHLPKHRAAVAAALLAAAAYSYADARLWRPYDRIRERFVDAVVRMTSKDDFVFDLKGDAVFRQRAATYVYEDVGRALTERGAIPEAPPTWSSASSPCCWPPPPPARSPSDTR